MNPDPDIFHIKIRPAWCLEDIQFLDEHDILWDGPLAADAEETMPPRAMALRDTDRRTDRMRTWFWRGYLSLWIIGIAALVWWQW